MTIGLLESLLLKTDRADEEQPQYHVHQGPCCVLECVTQRTDGAESHRNHENDNSVSEQNIINSHESRFGAPSLSTHLLEKRTLSFS